MYDGGRYGISGQPEALLGNLHVSHSMALKTPPMQHQDDFALIRRVAAKERQAFEILYQRYYARLASYLAKFLKRQELIEEALNDVMLVVWSQAQRFNYTSRLSTWIFGIAYHKALKSLQQHAPLGADVLADAGEALAPSDPENPEELLGQQELRQIIEKALQDLSVEHRTTLELSFYHGFSCQEIADMMACPVNTVKTRLFYARKRLEPLLKEQGFGAPGGASHD